MKDPHRILVVDDEPDLEPLLLQRMRREIRRGVYDFRFACNGVDALEKLNRDPSIQLVLSDINMPEMDGLTLLQQIPSVNPNVRSVIVSAYGDMKNIRLAMNRGAFDFVTKPIDFGDLRITIDRTIKHLQMWKEALAARDKLISINHELDIANKMQQSILPKNFPRGASFRIKGCMEPARNIGGDFFDVYKLDRGHIGVAIADVSDKGVPAALFMMSSRTLLKGAAIGTSDPSLVLKEVNDLLAEDNDAGMFVTMFYAVFDPINGELTYSNGGHNPPLLVHSDGNSEYLEMPSGIALGMLPEFEFNNKVTRLSEGDRLIMYTDGITEAMNSKNELYGEKRLQEFAFEAVNAGKDDLGNLIIAEIHSYSEGIPQSDDITCLSITYFGDP